MSNCAVFFNTMRTEQKTSVKNSIGRLVFVGISVLLQVIWIINLFLWLNRYSAAISLFSTLIAVSVVFAIYGTHGNMAFKVPWMLLIAAFPIFGLCVFLLFGRSNLTRSMKKRYELIDEELFPFLNGDDEVIKELQEKDLSIANQSDYIWKYGHYPVYHNTDVAFYADASQGLEAQLAELKKAEHFIFMEYHAIEQAESFERILNVLKDRAAHGVEVRIFYDDVGSIGFINHDFRKRMEENDIACRVFNPIIPVLSVFMNNRDHRKITVIDGKVGFTGGYNLANEYFNITHPYGHWKDTGIRLEGDAVKSLTVMFLEMWNAVKKTDQDYQKYLPETDYQAKQDGFIQPYADSPLDDEHVGESVYMNLIAHAKKEIYFTTPYLIITDEMNRALGLAAKRGVDVRIVTPGISDKKLIYKVTRSYYAGLVRQGVRIYEYTPGFIHAKQCVCDGEAATCGTINMDYRSLYLHFENGAFLYNCDAVKEMRKDFEHIFAESTEVTEKYKSGRSAVLRGTQCLLRLFAPLM